MRSYLIVVAHPDDEVLGAGGSIHKWAKEGHKISVCVLCGYAETRMYRPETSELKEDITKSMNLLNVNDVIIGKFTDSNLNSYPHKDVVRFIENAIIKATPNVIITHHPNDLNNDHRVTSMYTQEAARLSQRKTIEVTELEELAFMEVLSSTDWALSSAHNSFKPNSFVEIGKDGLEVKINALRQYRGVMRDYPHPRSEECLKGLSALRGAQSGQNYAEAFESVFRKGDL